MTQRRFPSRMIRSAMIAVLAVTAAGVAGSLPADARADGDATFAVTARAVRQGEVVRLDVTCACGAEGPSARAFGVDVPFFPGSDGSRWHALVGIDLEVPPGEHPIVLELPGASPPRQTVALRVLPGAFAERNLRVAPAFVDPPAAVVARLTGEAAMLNALYGEVTPRLWTGPFQAPVPHRVSGGFGSRSVFNGQARNPHAGVDFRSPAGTPVAAPAAGRVILADDLYFTGKTVVLDHGLGLVSVLAHLSSIDVSHGHVVAQGAKVGRVGATGRVTAPHLHWSVRLGAARVDPLSLIVATDAAR